jgi:hypothetical protein
MLLLLLFGASQSAVAAAAAAHAAAGSEPVLSSWAGEAATVTTNAPVLRWASAALPGTPGLDPTAIIAIRVNVSGGGGGGSSGAAAEPWSTGEVRTNVLSTWQGLAVYEGPGLSPGATYSWTAEERVVAFSNGTTPASAAFATLGRGTFTAVSSLPSAKAEAAAAMSAANMSALWNGSWHSINDRIEPSGFLPTSVSGGYGGITQMFVRDASGQLIGLLQTKGAEQTATVKSALRFMLSQLQEHYSPATFLSYAPHVMHANKKLTEIISFDSIDQTDDTFYLVAAWGHYLDLAKDTAMRADFYDLLKNYTLHYFAPGARSYGKPPGTPAKPKAGGGVMYWNESLSLVWNPNLEHSRLGSYWSCYDQLSNSFAAEGLRVLSKAAMALSKPADAALWAGWRQKVLHGIGTSLTYSDPVNTGGETIFGELRGHENGFSEDKGEPGYSPYLWGISYENIVPVVLGLSVIDGSGLGDTSTVGLDTAKLDRTWEAYRRLASLQWITTDPENSAFVSMTHVNSSGFTDPPAAYGSPAPPPTPCEKAKWLKGKDALRIASGPDIAHTAVKDAGACCAACKNHVRPNKGRAPGCGVWFFNGESGTCYLKSHGSQDKITKPSPKFAAGYGAQDDDSWCTFTGSFQDPAHACPAPGGKTCACPSLAVIGKGIGWELGWAAHRKAYTRLISLHRWLGQASHVEQTTLFGESYNYPCMLEGERNGFASLNATNPRGSGCWGDPGNGVQIGWFVWGEALARTAVGLPPVDEQ